MIKYVVLAALLLPSPGLFANADDELIDRIQDAHARGTDHWVYNDIEAARLVARATGKPMFVTFRCVPCKACNGFDAEVAQGSSLITDFASKEFVCVRQVEMKNVDLSQFQFDHDLSWAAMFINADGTVYGRYGTQSAKGPDAYNSIEGLKATMDRVLKLHANYPGNKEELAGKRGKAKPYKTAMGMPGLPANAKRFKETTTRKNCIHCHMIHDAENQFAQKSGTFKQDLLWRYPLPENIGITIDSKHGRRIEKADGNLLTVGHEISHVNGQAITSIADIQWVLHNLPNESALVSITTTATATSKNGIEAPVPSTVGFQTKPGWKKTDISWRGSIYSLSPVFPVWAPPLQQDKRDQLKMKDGDPALEVRWINRGKPGGKQAFQAGLREHDVILKVNGKTVPPSPQKLQTYIKLNHKVGDTLTLDILRKGSSQQITVKLVE